MRRGLLSVAELEAEIDLFRRNGRTVSRMTGEANTSSRQTVVRQSPTLQNPYLPASAATAVHFVRNLQLSRLWS